MWILGLILTGIGVALFSWLSSNLNKPRFSQPLMFRSVVVVFVLNILSLGLVLGGLVSFWQTSPWIVAALVGGYAVLWILGRVMGSTKSRAKKFFRIYRQMMIAQPQLGKPELCEAAARIYLKTQGIREGRIDSLIEAASTKEETETSEIAFFSSLLAFQEPTHDFTSPAGFKRFMVDSEKRTEAAIRAHAAVFGKGKPITERPELSAETLKRMRENGMDPDAMTNEQLAAFESLENPNKGHWVSQIFTYGGFGSGIVAFINIFSFDWFAVVVFGVIGFILSQIGFRIQRRIANKKFQQASILKWSEEQRKKAS